MVDFKKRLAEKQEKKTEDTVELDQKAIEMKQGQMEESVSEWNKKNKDDYSEPGNKLSPIVERKKISPQDFEKGQYMQVSCKFGLTLNLNNMEFARYDVGMETFCAPEDRDDFFNEMEKELKKKAFTTASNVTAYLDKKRKAGIGE